MASERPTADQTAQQAAEQAAARRLSGILLHITSLPSYGGIGDLGPAAYAFVDFLVAAKQRMWQVLPLSPTGYGSSPYSALSAFAGNPMLISLETLVHQGWLAGERIAGLPGADGPCDFASAFDRKLPLIEEAAANFLAHADPAQRAEYDQFCQANVTWLTDWATFSLLRRRFAYVGWHDWPIEFAHRDPAALAALAKDSAPQLAVEQVIQFFFDQQWRSLRAYCADRHIRIMGDVAIFVSYDSADVWCHPEVFELDADREPIAVAGVPPDYFSATGQRWGNPLYDWQMLERTGFDWWVARLRRALALYDVTRLDHFRGFEAFWAIPAAEPTAVHGQWRKAPGQALFHRLREVLGSLPLVAEDLGVITPEVDQLREDFGLPGMRVLQFGFGDRGGHLHLPHKYIPNSVVYTGTHDNNTTLGWWQDSASDSERQSAETYLGRPTDPAAMLWAMIRAAEGSVADTCILPLQDVLGLGSEARMNTPAATFGNWCWRYHPGALRPELAAALAELMAMTDRDGYVPPVAQPAVPIATQLSDASSATLPQATRVD